MRIIYKKSSGTTIKSIEFCCWQIAYGVLKNSTVKIPYYGEIVEIAGDPIRHCPFCGRKIEHIKLEEPYEDT